MHSYNLCTGAYHLTKFLVLDGISRSAACFLTLAFHLCFEFETVIDLDQYTGLVTCVFALCLHVYIVLTLLVVVLSVQLYILVLYCFSHFNTLTIFSTFCFSII